MSSSNGHPPTQPRWTQGLASRLLADLPEEELRSLLETAGHAATRLADARDHLLEAAKDQAQLRHHIIDAWRRQQQHLVTATEMIQLAAPDAALGREALLQHFDAEDVLLELITDPRDDGWSLAEEFVEQVGSESLRAELQELLRTWSETDVGETDASSRERIRVVVFGGHPRDESRLAPLFADGPFAVRWRTWERRAGDSADMKMVTAALAHADAAVIVTGMASHNIMEMVRGYAKKYGLPWRCIAKATDAQLSAALDELLSEFPSEAGRERR